MIKTRLIRLFKLENNEELFKKAITPKSCGGDDSFKFLALIGDNILDLMLLEIQSEQGLKDTGLLTPFIQSFHNERTLSLLGYHLKIDQLMRPMDPNHVITPGEVKESVEALLGATYKANKLTECQEVVKSLVNELDAVKENTAYSEKITGIMDSNPKGRLQELFQKEALPLPEFQTERVGGPDHRPMFRCTVIGEYFGKTYQFHSDPYPNKKDAERHAAQKFLAELGQVVDESTISKPIIAEKVTMSATQSLVDRTIVFSKSEGKETERKLILPTETGEPVMEWAYRKYRKNPYGLALILSARFEEISGSSWTATIDTGELILLNMEIEGTPYFEVGFGSSKHKARKDAAIKIIQLASVFEWLENKYGGKTI